jgi:4-hydroxy-4-methyl-2-oxoglutarate aldolase
MKRAKPISGKPMRTILRELAEFETALLANTIGYIDPAPPHTWYMGGSIRCVTPPLTPSVGIAATCEIDTSTPGGSSDMELFWRQLDEIKNSQLPTIWVVQCVGSRPDHECVLGDGMAKLLSSAGCVAVVTNGGVRDAAGLLTVPMAAYAQGLTVHHTAIRIRAIGRPIQVGGITVRPGDVVHANAEGVILVPPKTLPCLAERAIEMRAFEYEAHLLFRREDLSFPEKREQVARALARHGFAYPAMPRGSGRNHRI